MVEENLKTHKKVMFTGPKGVGKTACLLAYWQKFVSLKKKVILLCPSTIKMFFENHAIQCYLKSLHKHFEHTKSETSLRLTISKYIIQENLIVLLDRYILQALVNNAVTWQSSSVIANNARKTQKLFVQGYNLEVHKVIKYM